MYLRIFVSLKFGFQGNMLYHCMISLKRLFIFAKKPPSSYESNYFVDKLCVLTHYFAIQLDLMGLSALCLVLYAISNRQSCQIRNRTLPNSSVLCNIIHRKHFADFIVTMKNNFVLLSYRNVRI